MDIKILLIDFVIVFIIIMLVLIKEKLNDNEIKNNGVKKWSKSVAYILEIQMINENVKDETLYNVMVLYKYTFENNEFTGKNICFDYKPSTDYKSNLKLFELLNKAKEIQVWVNPKYPNESVIVNTYFSKTDAFGLKFLYLFLGMFACVILAIMFDNMELPVSIVNNVKLVK